MTEHVSPVPREARPYQGLRAGLASRVLANVIDAMVITGVIVTGYFAVAGVRFLWNPTAFHLPALPWSTFLPLAYVISVVYFTFGWAGPGRSYGDHVLGLRVINHHGDRLAPLLSLLRAVFCVVFPLGLFWTAVSRENRSIQDLLLRTSVVYDWKPKQL